MFLFHASTTKNIATLPIKGVVPTQLHRSRLDAMRLAEEMARGTGELPIVIEIHILRLHPDHLTMEPLGYAQRVEISSRDIHYV